MAIHKITKGTKFTWLKRKQKPGYGNVIGVNETPQMVISIGTNNNFHTDYWANMTFYSSHFYSIEGVLVQDGDVIEIAVEDTYNHNRPNVGDIKISNIIRYEESDNYIESIIGTAKFVIVK
jgi:hypothetical protein